MPSCFFQSPKLEPLKEDPLASTYKSVSVCICCRAACTIRYLKVVLTAMRCWPALLYVIWECRSSRSIGFEDWLFVLGFILSFSMPLLCFSYRLYPYPFLFLFIEPFIFPFFHSVLYLASCFSLYVSCFLSFPLPPFHLEHSVGAEADGSGGGQSWGVSKDPEKLHWLHHQPKWQLTVRIYMPTRVNYP